MKLTYVRLWQKVYLEGSNSSSEAARGVAWKKTLKIFGGRGAGRFTQ